MVQVLIAADAEALLVAYLRAKLPTVAYPDVSVGTKVRSPRPARFVQVGLRGGVGRDRFTSQPLLVFHCWAETDVAASQLGRTVQALAEAAPGEYVLSGWTIDDYNEVGGLQNNPDPDSANPRYSFSAEFAFRKSVL